LFPIIVFCINVSHGNVATQLKCGGFFSKRFIAICPRNVAVKAF